MKTRFPAIPACLLAATLLHGGQERTHQAVGQPPLATEPAVLQRFGIDPSMIDAAQFRILSQLSEAGLRSALDGADPATIMALNGRTLDKVIFAAIGDVDEQLVYKPLSPCRLIDTRNAGGAFGSAETRHYNLIGPSNYSAYGGNASGCGIPNTYVSAGIFQHGNRVRALVLNLTAVQPTGIGFLIAWPANQNAPNASMLNYGNDFALANGVTARTCNASCDFNADPQCDPCPTGDLSIRNVSGTTHVLVDVLGYMEPAVIAEGSEGTTLGVSLSDNACKQLASCVATNSSSLPRGVTVSGQVNLSLNHTTDTTSVFRMTLSTSPTVCGDSELTGPGDGKFKVASQAPSFLAEGVVSASKRYTIPPNTSVTYYLNGRNFLGAGSGDVADGSAIQCIVNQ